VTSYCCESLRQLTSSEFGQFLVNEREEETDTSMI